MVNKYGRLVIGSLALALTVLLLVITGDISPRSSNAATLPGDLNVDNKVDVVDLSMLLGNYGKTGSGDLNGDGTVGILDLSILLSNFGKTGAVPAVAENRPVSAGIGGAANYNLSSNSYVMAQRIVFGTDKTIDRWYYDVKLECLSWVGGSRCGYATGTAGMTYGRIVNVDQNTGLPLLNSVLASETVATRTVHERARNEYGLVNNHQIHFVQFAPVTLKANQMYAFLVSNPDPNPGVGGSTLTGNHWSVNINLAPLSSAGPLGRNICADSARGTRGCNEYSREVGGSIAGLDPREATTWSQDGGKTWRFGAGVGWYNESSADAKIWYQGYREVGQAPDPYGGWPHLSWAPPCTGCKVTFKNATKAVTINKAGGFAGDGAYGTSSAGIGVITVRNETTGVSGKTASLGGGGWQSGNLDNPVPVRAGDSVSLTNTGSVHIGRNGGHNVFNLGRWFTSTGSAISWTNADRPALYAEPWFYYEGLAGNKPQ